MKFKAWIIQKGGAGVVAEMLGVTPHTVRTWLRSEATPRPKVMTKVIVESRGRVRYQDIIQETAR